MLVDKRKKWVALPCETLCISMACLKRDLALYAQCVAGVHFE